MKQIILILIVISATLTYAQNIKQNHVPAEVLTQLNSLYPDVKDVAWTKEGEIYIAEFTWEQVSTVVNTRWFVPKESLWHTYDELSVVFDRTGKLLQVVNFIQKKDLPKAAQNYLNKNYKQKALGEISKVKNIKNVITYTVEVKNDALVFDEHGKFLRVF